MKTSGILLLHLQQGSAECQLSCQKHVYYYITFWQKLAGQLVASEHLELMSVSGVNLLIVAMLRRTDI